MITTMRIGVRDIVKKVLMVKEKERRPLTNQNVSKF
jgi:hypothetical protein